MGQYRVQRKRFAELEKARKEDLLQKMKHDRDFGKEIISIVRSTTLRNSGTESLSRRNTLSADTVRQLGIYVFLILRQNHF